MGLDRQAPTGYVSTRRHPSRPSAEPFYLAHVGPDYITLRHHPGDPAELLVNFREAWGRRVLAALTAKPIDQPRPKGKGA